MIFHNNRKRKIIWQIHNAGLINQMMSLEMGAGIAFMENTPVVFYQHIGWDNRPIFSASVISEKRRNLLESPKPNLFDVVQIPHELKYTLDPNNNPDVGDAKVYEDNIKWYYKCKDGVNEYEFAEARPQLIVNQNKNCHFKTNNLAFYSRYFFNRTYELDYFFQRLTFRHEYWAVAERIASQLGPFSAMHIRLTDHCRNYDATTENRLKAFNKLKLYGLPIVVSTDDEAVIRQDFGSDFLSIDDIIVDNFAKNFTSLPYHDEIIYGLICLLILSFSTNFIGTPGSTFSSYIHRLRLNFGKENCLENMIARGHTNEYERTGPFSWNGFKMHTNVKNWWSEWPECKLVVNS